MPSCAASDLVRVQDVEHAHAMRRTEAAATTVSVGMEAAIGSKSATRGLGGLAMTAMTARPIGTRQIAHLALLVSTAKRVLGNVRCAGKMQPAVTVSMAPVSVYAQITFKETVVIVVSNLTGLGVSALRLVRMSAPTVACAIASSRDVGALAGGGLVAHVVRRFESS